jgi:hypothetical protein
VAPNASRPDEGWLRFVARQLFLGGLGFPGSDLLPAGGWLRRAAIAFYALLAILVLVILVLVIVQR